jgi:hypothetical protein
MKTNIIIEGAGGEFTHNLDLAVDETPEDLELKIRYALAGTQNTREIILKVPYGTLIVPAKVLHHSVITIKSIQ